MDFPEVRRRAIARFETPPALAEFVAEQLQDRRNASQMLCALDPTCGSGALLAPLQRAGLTCYGVDIDAVVATQAALVCQTPLGGRVKVGNALLDPVGPRRWPEWLAEQDSLLRRLAALRSQGDFEAAETLTAPVRSRLARRLPPELADALPFCWPLEFPEIFLSSDAGFHVLVTNPPWDKFKIHTREFFDPALRRLHASDQRRIRAERLSAAPLQDALVRERRRNAAFQQHIKAWSAEGTGDSRSRGDPNAYLAVLDLAHRLLIPGGALGAIVPGGFWADFSALAWRNRLFEAYGGVATWSFAPRTDAFPDIDQRAALVLARRQVEGLGTPTVRVSSGLMKVAELYTRPAFEVPIALIRRAAPESAAVPPLETPLDLAIVEKLYAAGPPFAQGIWQPAFGRELDMTADADAFDGVSEGAPLWEGKRIGRFELCPVDAKAAGALPACQSACTRSASCPYERRNGHQLWVDEAKLGKRDHGHAAHARVAWRSIARTDRARRLEAALVPAGYRLGNSLNYLVGDRMSLEDKLTVLALLNSLVVEWRFRHLSANNNVNLFAIRQLPMPEGATEALFEPAGALVLADDRFREWAATWRIAPVRDRKRRHDLRLQLEARVAKRFALSKAELARILQAFPKLPGADARAILSHFDASEV